MLHPSFGYDDSASDNVAKISVADLFYPPVVGFVTQWEFGKQVFDAQQKGPIPEGTINHNGHWASAWTNAAHTTCVATWVPENNNGNAMGAGHLNPLASGPGPLVGTMQIAGSCGSAIFAGLSGNPSVYASGLSCAANVMAQAQNGNLAQVLNYVQCAETSEQSAMSGSLADINETIDACQGVGNLTESANDGWTCSGDSAGSWGNGQTFSCTNSGSGGAGHTVVIRVDLQQDILHGL